DLGAPQLEAPELSKLPEMPETLVRHRGPPKAQGSQPPKRCDVLEVGISHARVPEVEVAKLTDLLGGQVSKLVRKRLLGPARCGLEAVRRKRRPFRVLRVLLRRPSAGWSPLSRLPIGLSRPRLQRFHSRAQPGDELVRAGALLGEGALH